MHTELFLNLSDPELVQALDAKSFPLNIPNEMLYPKPKKMSAEMAAVMNRVVNFAVLAFNNDESKP